MLLWSYNIIQRFIKEKKYFGDNDIFAIKTQKKLVGTGESNSKEVFGFVKDLKPKFVLLYGSSIIKDPLLSYFDEKIINIHLGLSPYYKGSATNIWPLVNGKPECVGATFHIANAKVDAGPIIHQLRPELTFSDDIHDIGNKTISDAGNQIKIVQYCIEKDINMLPQKKYDKEKIYRKKDFNEYYLQTAYKNINNGLLEKYLKNKKERDKNFPIIDRSNVINS